MNTTLKEYLSDLRGMYSHGYFYMYINGDFDSQLRKLSVRDLGTFSMSTYTSYRTYPRCGE